MISSDTKLEKYANPKLLWRYVLVSFIIQAVLAVSVLVFSGLSNLTIDKAYSFAVIAASQRNSFQSIGITTRRFAREIKSSNPNRVLILRLQERLNQEINELQKISDEIEKGLLTQGFSFVSVDNSSAIYRDIKFKLDRFLQSLNTLSLISYEKLAYHDRVFDQVSFTVAPNSSFTLSINAISKEFQSQASKLSEILLIVKAVMVALMIFIIALVGRVLIYPAFINLSRAINEEHKLRLKMENMAYQDRMTGLLSRAGMDLEIESIDSDESYAYAIIDLNTFKSINDTFGHAAGDAVLIEVGKRLNAACRPLLKVARIGGDEFAVLYPNVTSRDQCEELGGSLIEIFSHPIKYMDMEYSIGASIGIALSNEVEGSFYEVSKAADAAMYSLKGISKTGFDIFTSKYHASSNDLNRKSEITEAINNEEIGPVYQAKVDLFTNQTIGFEALARWHTQYGMIKPENFIAGINQFGQQYNFTLCMFDKVLRDLRLWHSKNCAYPVSINVSPEVLALNMSVRSIIKKLNEYSDVKHLITIELTEDVFLPRLANAVRKSVSQLVDEGIHFSIDDFGSGYASYRHLNEFTFHELKVDKSFIDGIGQGGSAEIILQSVYSIAQGLNVKLVAEGIETQEQVDFLKSENYTIGQGFFFSKAMESDQVIENHEQMLNINNLQRGKNVILNG